jgi:hypothetical protein
MAMENPTWGAPRIHGELLKLGFDVSEPTVSRWLRRVRRTPDPAQRWLTFLRNHREAIAAMDFFTVPTLTFGVLYCFFVIGHDRRRILRCTVTRNPLDRAADAGSVAVGASTPVLVVRPRREVWQQLGVVRERDGKPTYPHCLSQSVAKRGCGALGRGCRRDLLDHMIVLKERHLKRLLAEYVRYYHEDRTHLGLERRTRQQVGRLYGVMPLAARFALSRDLVDSTTVTRLSPRTL